MAMRGQRFVVNTDVSAQSSPGSSDTPDFGLLGDIKERNITFGEGVPSPPRPQLSSTGFPAHKRRQLSKFKARRTGDYHQPRTPDARMAHLNVPPSPASQAKQAADGSGLFAPSIDAENRDRLSHMSETEISQARSELLAGLSPSLIERLLKKAKIDEDETTLESQTAPKLEIPPLPPQESIPDKNLEATRSRISKPANGSLSNLVEADMPPLQPPSDLHPVSSKQALPPLPDLHFPRVPTNPDLDPNDPDFLSKLHSTYFPSLPSDPSAMAWMAPVKHEEQESYSPSQESLPISSLRFDFRGRLLPPRLSSQIPPTKGLHHHGHNPESAGYTVPELSRLGRSTITSQRCIAYQTLGRILYRLGRGDFGTEGDDLCEGLWELIEKEKALQGLVKVASKENEGSRSLWATATDAVWLWRKGGGRRWNGR